MEYKGVEVDDALGGLIEHMEKVEEYRGNLQALQTVWDNLTLLGHLSGTGTDMTDTRRAFHKLTGSLLNQLGRETLKKTVLAMGSKAQVAVDIMIRNLFERTADIGFLSMDDEIRDYLRSLSAMEPDANQAATAALIARFREYTRKYSVYSNIILLDLQGNVLVQLDAGNPVSDSADPLLAESLSTTQAYVETFRPSDLQPGDKRSLIYSYRVEDPKTNVALGVLCLCFRFEDEAEKIFANLVGSHDWNVVTLLDRQGKVIASSDPYHIPAGAGLQMALDVPWKVLVFAGREYLAITRQTQGYQGYMGPGWYGQVMVPLEHAFECEVGRDLDNIPADVLQAVTRNTQLFSESLREIPIQAASIQRDLNRSVWNGNVRQRSDRKAMNPAFSKVLLWEISNTGLKTQDVFERSIGNLHQTVVSAILQDSRFQSSLSIEIMDRNLYERANDCRWWALAPLFGRTLANGRPTAEERERVAETLASINALYTVYDNLVLFDRNGEAVAVSNPAYQEWVGKPIGEDWCRQTLSLRDSQSYAVSRFAKTPLYKGRHTYIYAAAIRHPADEAQVVGGIGIVFDAEPQFVAMLNDALPRDERGEVPPGCFGLFVDRDKGVIASTERDIPPGSRIDLDDAFFRLRNREGRSSITVFNNRYYAIGARMSGGYREYKGAEDEYRNDVLALVFMPLGEMQEDRRQMQTARNRLQSARNGNNGAECIEVATFYVDDNWLGVPAEHVVEAVDAAVLTTVPGCEDCSQSYLMFRDRVIPVVGLWGLLGREDRRRTSQSPQVIVLNRTCEEGRDTHIGIMVDELGEIPEVPVDRVERISSMLAGENLLAESVVKPVPGDVRGEMIVLISAERLCRRFLS